MEKKTITIEMLKASFNSEIQDYTENPVFQLACVLSKFSIKGLRDDYESLYGKHLREKDLELLLDHSTVLKLNGYYFLEEYLRVSVLKKFIGQKNFKSLIKIIALKIKGDPFQEMLVACLEGKVLDLYNLSVDELSMMLKISEWLKGTSIQIPPVNEINIHLTRESLLEPFRLLTKNFYGRKEELKRIEKYVNGKSENKNYELAPFLISGIGGIGKSALVAKFTLDLFKQNGQKIMPFIYIDFDKPGLSIAEPLKLASEGLHQLEIQFPNTNVSAIFSDIKRDIHTYLNKNKNNITKYQSTESERGIFYGSIYRQYLIDYQSALMNLRNPVLIILDSFEEAQHRASASEIDNFFSFLIEVGEFIPQARFILTGRDDLVGSNYKIERLLLNELDKEAAEGYLLSKGIKNEKLCKFMVQQLGGNPLSLKLAANYVLKIPSSEIKEIKNFANLFSAIDRERIQEQLFRRNLLHINDSEVKKIAFPGMLVRIITPDIIKKVLAEPCDLGIVGDDEANRIFNNLQKEDFLISRESGSIVFRRDLRIALYDLILEEYGEKVNKIHNLAVEYYKSKSNEPRYKAEYLYHMLKRGDSPDIIDNIYVSELRPFIENSLTELPLNAKIKLASVMGISVSTDVVSEARSKEWEIYMIKQIQDILDHGDENGLHQMKKSLATRSERTGNNDLYYYEAKVNLRLGEFAQARKIIDILLTKKNKELKAMILKAQVYEYNLQFGKAYKFLNEFDFKNTKDVLPSNLIQYFILLLRNGKRDGRSIDNIWDKHKDMLINTFFSIISKQSNTNIHNFDLYQSTLPLAYRSFTSNFFPSPDKKFSIDKLNLSVLQLWDNFLSATDFKSLYNISVNKSKNKLWLEQKLFNQFKFSINNISEPAILNINIVDTLIFIEQEYKGNIKNIEINFLQSGNTTKKDQLPEKFNDFIFQNDLFINRESLDELIRGKEPLFELIRDEESLFELISGGDIKAALNKLINQFSKNDSDKNDLMLVMSRFNQLEREISNGLINIENYNIEKNRIQNALLNIIDKA